MISFKTLAACMACAAAIATAESTNETIFRAMNDEMARSMARLEMEKLGKPYYMALNVMSVSQIGIGGMLGGLKNSTADRSRALSVDLRVGSAAFDNTHFIAGNYGPVLGGATVGTDYDALRFDLWLACDAAYKKAVDTLTQKTAYKQRKMIIDMLPDMASAPVTTSIIDAAACVYDRAYWEDAIRKLSAVFTGYPGIAASGVNLAGGENRTYFVDSQGRTVLKPEDCFSFSVSAAAQASDGIWLRDGRSVLRPSLESMPPYEELHTMVKSLADDLAARCAAPKWEGVYLGPVMFEKQAAAMLFAQLLARNIASPRPIWAENTEQFRPGTFTERLNLRVISPLLSVVDDPTLAAFDGVPLLGHYAVDDEGVPAQSVSVIEKGIMRNILMGRSPTKRFRKSNGHGRAAAGQYADGRVATLVISAQATSTPEEMKRELLRRAEEFGQPFGIVVRTVDEGASGGLGQPLVLYKVDVKTGREDIVRNVEFNDVTLRTLRDIVMVSSNRYVCNFEHVGPTPQTASPVPASLVYPNVLVAEMELKATEEKPDKMPYLPNPAVAAGGAKTAAAAKP